MNQTTTMWAVHVQGPDDLHACPDRETADALALVLNGQFMRHSKPGEPLMVATVTEWPYGYEAWRAASEQLQFVPVPVVARQAGQEHIASESCWCGPEASYVDPDTGATVFVHRRSQ